MSHDLPYTKFKILFINVFIILYKAATLNPNQLKSNLGELKCAFSDKCKLPNLFAFLISLLVVAKFLMGYVSIAANVIAIFPILSDEQPELLLPSILTLAIENVLLSSIELLLGYCAVKFYIAGKTPIFVWFMAKLIVKIVLSVSVINIYSDLYNEIKFPVIYKRSEEALPENSKKNSNNPNPITRGSTEQLIREQRLS